MSANHSRPNAGCESCRGRIGPWLDGELETAAAAAVERHLGACPDCRAAAADHRAIAQAIRSLAGTPVPPIDIAAIRARVRRIECEEIGTIRTLKRLAAAAAVVLALALGAAFWTSQGRQGNGSPDGPDVSSQRDAIMALVISNPTWEEEFR